MPETPRKLIKNTSVVLDDQWQLVDKEQATIPAGDNLVLPFVLWQKHEQEISTRNDVGVWFDSDELPFADIAAKLQALPLIAVSFPVFSDGRGFSIARLLRERFGYKNELRAIGHVLRDQLCFMRRCGFNSFVLQAHVDAQAALSSLNEFTEFYQTAVDQPLPLFRRRG